jgi:hypothetical protein
MFPILIPFRTLKLVHLHVLRVSRKLLLVLISLQHNHDSVLFFNAEKKKELGGYSKAGGMFTSSGHYPRCITSRLELTVNRVPK